VEEPRAEESIEEQLPNSEEQLSKEKDPWMGTLIVGDSNAERQSCAKRGPTYKVGLVVDGVKTRGSMDYGAQVSLVRKVGVYRYTDTYRIGGPYGDFCNIDWSRYNSKKPI